MIFLVGRDHRYSVAEREELIATIPRHHSGPSVYLQTCNRVEWYRGDGDASEHIARHLFRVSAGLESKMVGEHHILGQIRRAYRESIESGLCSSGLHRLFQHALLVGKRVRRETGLGRGAFSHSQAALSILRATVDDLRRRYAVIVGANHLTFNIARGLRQLGCEHLTILNRTPEKVLPVVDELGCVGGSTRQLGCALWRSDIVVTAVSSAQPIIDDSHIWDEQPRIIIDLGVPRNVAPRLQNNPALTVLSIDKVEEAIEQNLSSRIPEIHHATMLIEEEVRRYLTSSRRVRMSVPALTALT